jgi:cytochrome P450
MSYILRHNDDEKGMSKLEITENSATLILAGSETTATLLSGATFLLLKNRDKYETLTKEIRSAFKSAEDITLGKVNQLEYLLAVLNESLRMCEFILHLKWKNELTVLDRSSCADWFAKASSGRGRVHGRVLDPGQRRSCWRNSISLPVH